MIINTRFVSFAKTAFMLSASVAILSACSDKGTSTPNGETGKRTAFELSTDHALGEASAAVTIVEYASVACGHCANWHETVWPDIQSKYVKTGKVRYIYREFPTGNVSLATAGHLLANCAGDDKFFGLIGVQMKRHDQIMRSKDPKSEYVALAKSAGMTEADFDACMANQDQIDRLQSIADHGNNTGVTGTPAFFINGKQHQVFTIDDFDKILAPLLGEPISEVETPVAEPEKAEP